MNSKIIIALFVLGFIAVPIGGYMKIHNMEYADIIVMTSPVVVVISVVLFVINFIITKNKKISGKKAGVLNS